MNRIDKVKFKQIAADGDRLYGLDEDGRVWSVKVEDMDPVPQWMHVDSPRFSMDVDVDITDEY